MNIGVPAGDFVSVKCVANFLRHSAEAFITNKALRNVVQTFHEHCRFNTVDAGFWADAFVPDSLPGQLGVD